MDVLVYAGRGAIQMGLLRAFVPRDDLGLRVHRDLLGLQDVAYTAARLAPIADASAVQGVDRSAVHSAVQSRESGLDCLPWASEDVVAAWAAPLVSFQLPVLRPWVGYQAAPVVADELSAALHVVGAHRSAGLVPAKDVAQREGLASLRSALRPVREQ